MSYASDALIDAQEREIKKLKTENDKLKRFAKLDEDAIDFLDDCIDDLNAEYFKLRGLILDMLVDEERGHNDDGTYYEHVERAKELGIEAER